LLRDRRDRRQHRRLPDGTLTQTESGDGDRVGHAADGDETGGSARRARLAGGLAVTGIIVAIDGPSGSGKSTISKRLAASRGLAYLDTGAMYRAATWWCRHEQIDLTDQDAVATAVREMPLELGLDPEGPTFTVAGTDVATAIR